MKQREKQEWSEMVSGQIAVYKTDKALLELWDRLKPASELFPAHIHAAGEDAEQGEYSLIRLNMLDYSSENRIKVYANISPEEAIYIYSALFCHLLGFEFSQEKIFGIPDESGYSTVTKLQIARYDVDSKGNIRRYPWYVEIQNGRGIADTNANGGRHCRKGSYICDKMVRLSVSDLDMFKLFKKADSYIRAFENENAFRQNRVGNFVNLYRLLKKDVDEFRQRQEEILSGLWPEGRKAA